MEHETLLKAKTLQEVSDYISEGLEIDNKHFYFIPFQGIENNKYFWQYIGGYKINVYNLELLIAANENTVAVLNIKSRQPIFMDKYVGKSSMSIKTILDVISQAMTEIAGNLVLPALNHLELSDQLPAEPPTYVFNSDDKERIEKFAEENQ